MGNEKGGKTRLVKKIFFIVLQLILIGVMVFAGRELYLWWKDNKESEKILGEASNSITSSEDGETKVDFNELKKKNPDTVAYIKVEGMKIEYPVVKCGDNNFYLNHSFDKSLNKAGWIFMDFRNEGSDLDKNMVIYGHNRKDGSMFGTLKNILTKEWQEKEENKYITFINEKGSYVYEVFSVYKVESESYYTKTGFKNETEYESFLKTIKSRSSKNFGNEVSGKDRIMTLSTCADNDKYRVVLHAKRSEKNK